MSILHTRKPTSGAGHGSIQRHFCLTHLWCVKSLLCCWQRYLQQSCIQLPDREGIPGSKKCRQSFLLLQFHFHCWKRYECRKRSWASPPLKMYSTRLIALPKEICRSARNSSQISWHAALCLQLKAILPQYSLLCAGWVGEGSTLLNSVS